MVIVTGTISVDPAQREQFLEQMLPLTIAGRSEQGCLDHLMSPDPTEAGRVLIYERWATDEDLERHLAHPRPAPAANSVPVIDRELVKYQVATSEPLHI